MIPMLKELPEKTDGYQNCKNHPFQNRLKKHLSMKEGCLFECHVGISQTMCLLLFSWYGWKALNK
jgi:hypothetical protein